MSTYEHFKKFVEAKTEGFDFGDQENESFLANIINYFGTGQTNLDRNKGLLIRGSVGVGKTGILQVIQRWLPQEKKFAYNPANDIVSLFNADGDKALEVYKKKKERLFDDLGAEDKGRYYGNTVEVFDKIIQQRYDKFRAEGMKTHLTTNLTNEQLNEKYGKRSYDRLRDMCNLVNWPTTESRRGKEQFRWKDETAPQKQIEPTREDLIRFRREYIQNCLIVPYEALKEGRNIFQEDNALYFFTYFYKRKAFTVSAEQQEKYREKAQFYTKSEAVNQAKNQMQIRAAIKKLGLEADPNSRRVKEKACAIFFVDWCRELIQKGVNINDLIKQHGLYNPIKNSI